MALRVLSIVGTRPQIVKAAVVTRALASRGIAEVMVHTGQHFDVGMSDIFFQELGIPDPAHHLGVRGGGHGEMTGRMLQALEPVLSAERPAVALVYGDTNSTLAGAIGAAKLQIPVAHVEAGLRSFDRTMPEELNRVVTDHLSTLLLCPTRTAVANLAKEGIAAGVHHVGDVMFDAALHASDAAAACSQILQRLNIRPRRYAVATVHRPANTDDAASLRAVMQWLEARAVEHPVVLPLHPRTQQAMAQAGLTLNGVRVINPVGFLDMTRLLRDAAAIYTDSGGIQKEAYFHRVPCVTLRPNTEWVETIAAGWNRLWRGPDYVTPRREIDEFGDGRAAEKIVDILVDRFDAR
jgi:UDP-GlcNAc3NAcA epimerase